MTTKPVSYYVETPEIRLLAKLYGDKFEKISTAEKFSLIARIADYISYIEQYDLSINKESNWPPEDLYSLIEFSDEYSIRELSISVSNILKVLDVSKIDVLSKVVLALSNYVCEYFDE